MKPAVKLSDIAENIEMASDGAETFYNELTGEFYYYNQDFSDDDRDLDEEEGWLRLPSQRDADEYEMMSEFADIVEDSRKRGQLDIALSGRGAFRRFKDAVNREGIAEEWYAFRDKMYLEFARDWCEDEGIPYDSSDLIIVERIICENPYDRVIQTSTTQNSEEVRTMSNMAKGRRRADG
jgi:hypothetical protein